MEKCKCTKFAAMLILMVVIAGVSASIVFTPQSQSIQVRAAADETTEYIVTFKTIDGVIIAAVQTVEGLIPVELIPNAPLIDKRPFLRWTNVQGFSLDGLITANITFLPLYSYDPQWNVDDDGNGSGGTPNTDKGHRKTQWLFMNYLVDENAIIVCSLIGLTILLFLLILFLRLLKEVFK